MAHRWRPSSTFTWKIFRRSYIDGQEAPSIRCCSTEAGSVSPCVTITRRKVERYSPNLLPSRLSFVNPEIYFALLIARLQENSPPVIRHLHIAELCPAVGFHAGRRSQVHLVVVALVRPHVIPPAHIRGLPMLQRAL